MRSFNTIEKRENNFLPFAQRPRDIAGPLPTLQFGLFRGLCAAIKKKQQYEMGAEFLARAGISWANTALMMTEAV